MMLTHGVDDHLRLAQPLGAQRLDEILVQDLRHRRAGGACHDAERRQRQRDDRHDGEFEVVPSKIAEILGSARAHARRRQPGQVDGEEDDQDRPPSQNGGTLMPNTATAVIEPVGERARAIGAR